MSLNFKYMENRQMTEQSINHGEERVGIRRKDDLLHPKKRKSKYNFTSHFK